MAKKMSKTNSHKWFVGLIMWLGILWSAYSNTFGPAFIGIGVALAYMIYYVHG